MKILVTLAMSHFALLVGGANLDSIHIQRFKTESAGIVIAQQSIDPIKVEIRERHIEGEDVIRVMEGAAVEIHLLTDETVTLHLHGYDIEVKVKPESTSVMRFVANANGRFPVTSHGFGAINQSTEAGHGHSALFYIEVHPK